MNFPDYIRMDAQEPCCISHNEICSYLRNYTEYFQLRRYIQVIDHISFSFVYQIFQNLEILVIIIYVCVCACMYIIAAV